MQEYRKNTKENWPRNPRTVYKKQWKGWSDFLGKKKTNWFKPNSSKKISYKELHMKVNEMRIKNQTDYEMKRKPDWPASPKKYYKKEWINWKKFLCWRPDITALSKQKLLEMAKNNKSRPSNKTKIGRRLIAYTNSAGSSYDKEFTTLKSERNNAIKAVLTAEQVKKFEEAQKPKDGPAMH